MNRKSWGVSFLTPLLMVASFLMGSYVVRPGPTAAADVADKVAEVVRQIHERYPDDVREERLETGAVSGLLEALDPHCEYFTAGEWKDWEERHLSGRFYGVGIQVETDPETRYVRILTPIENTPAFCADILPGDLIVAVDGADIRGRLLDDVVQRIKGDKGTRVTLTLLRKGREPFDVTLTRDEIRVRAVRHRMVDPDAGIGYVRIADFTEMMDQFDAAIDDLKRQGLKALLVDLRFNSGGLLQMAVELSDRFLPGGQVIVSTRGRHARDARSFSAKPDDDLPFPLVVLINGSSASASEIFAGAMKDLRRGVLVGSRTFGKGTMQTTFPLKDESRLKLTTARWYTPGGANVNPGKGLQPDYLVEMSPEEEVALLRAWAAEQVVKGPASEKPAVRDYPLDAALEIARARIAGREPRVEPRGVELPKAEEGSPR